MPDVPTDQTVHVLGLRAEDFLRLKLVVLHPAEVGVTRIVGRNGQGKTSILNAIAAALGGSAQSPAEPIRAGRKKAEVVVKLKTPKGVITVTKTWKATGTTLEIRGEDGHKHDTPQTLLNTLYGELTFDPLAFTRMKPAEQAERLAKLAGIDLLAYQARRKAVYDERSVTNKALKVAEGAYQAMPDVVAPAEPVSVADLMAELAKAEEVNDKKAKLAEALRQTRANEALVKNELDACATQVAKLEEEMRVAINRRERTGERHAQAVEATVDAANRWEQAPAADTSPIKQRLTESQDVNRKVQQKRDKDAARGARDGLEQKAETLTAKYKQMEQELKEKLAKAALPVPGLGLDDAGVVLRDVPFSQASAAEQLRVSVAIGFALNPRLKLCLIRDGSLLDAESMAALAEMATEAGAQVLVERVAGAGETGVIIEDGTVVEESELAPAAAAE